MTRWGLPIAVLALFAATASGYGVFRDELYYIACGAHLDWGYVDHPPLVALVAAASRALFGPSWIALRLISAVAFAGTILLVGDTARALGGGGWGRILAQVLAATSPGYLSLFSIFSMNAFDILIWAGLARIAAHILAGGSPRLWLLFGAVAGLGLQNKIDVALLGAGLVVGLAISGRFELFRERWIWLGGALAAVIFTPHVIWQVVHDFPTQEFIENAQRGKIVRFTPLGFVLAQFLLIGPVGFSLALAGIGWLLAARSGRPFRPLGWAALAVLAALALSVSKPYYFAPTFALLFPAAGVAIEAWTAGRFARPARVAALAASISMLFAAPLAKPLLSADRYVRYASALGFAPRTDEHHRLGRLSQFFADMHGWREMAMSVARVNDALSPEDRAKACVYGRNYGEAAAIDYFGPELGLPPAISGHNSYWIWGPGSCTGEILLIIGGDRDDHLEEFATVEPGGSHDCVDCMPYEDDLTIWVARGLLAPLTDAWGATKHYD